MYFYVTMLAIWLSLMGFQAKSEPRQVIVTKSFICDTIEQLKSALDAAKPGHPLPVPEGCGHLQQPSPALMEELESYETPLAHVLLIRLVFPNFGEQYGFSAYIMKPKELGS